MRRDIFLMGEYLAQSAVGLRQASRDYSAFSSLFHPSEVMCDTVLLVSPLSTQQLHAWYRTACSIRDSVSLVNKAFVHSRRIAELPGDFGKKDEDTWAADFSQWHTECLNLLGPASDMHFLGSTTRPKVWCGQMLKICNVTQGTAINTLADRAHRLRARLNSVANAPVRQVQYVTTAQIVSATDGAITSKMLDNRKSSLDPQAISGLSRGKQWRLDRVMQVFREYSELLRPLLNN